MSAEKSNSHAELEERLRFETLLAELALKFVNLPASEVDREVSAAQRRLCKWFDLDLLVLWQPSGAAPGSFSVSHIYSAQKGPQPVEWLKQEDYPWFSQEMLAGRVARFSSLEELPPEAARDRVSFRQLGTKSNLSLPLSVGGEPLIGAFCLNTTRAQRDWPEALVKRLQLVAQIFANALARKRMQLAAQRLSGRLINAQEAERARLARELHDDITQRLARLAIDVARCERATSEDSVVEAARQVRRALVQLSEDVHGLAYQLHPSILVDLGLAEALKAELERFGSREPIAVKVNLHKADKMVPHDSALCLYRVAQEALRNIARHARARNVAVSLRGLDGGVQLAVQDDGCGFEPALHRELPSLGLASMRERVKLLGGELDIDSAPGQGATILAWLPLEKGSP